MKFLLAIFIFTLSSFGFAFDYKASQMVKQTIDIENRILLKINGKAITTMDIVRKMDLIFYRQYPEMAASEAARFQFYNMSWAPIFQTVIDEELMLADAEEKEIPITDGEVRQEMESLFGPQVVLTLDKLNLTFEEAFELLKRELMVQKVTSAFVRNKAITEVNPAAVRAAYKKMLEEPLPDNSFVYQYVTVRGSDVEACKGIAEEIYKEVRENQRSVKESIEQYKHILFTITLSETYKRDEGDIALAHLKALKKLQPTEMSAPILCASHNETPYYRIFILHEYKSGAHPPLSEVEGRIKQQLMQEAYALHNEKYRNKLRAYYDINDNYLASFTPKEFKPFALR